MNDFKPRNCSAGDMIPGTCREAWARSRGDWCAECVSNQLTEERTRIIHILNNPTPTITTNPRFGPQPEDDLSEWFEGWVEASNQIISDSHDRIKKLTDEVSHLNVAFEAAHGAGMQWTKRGLAAEKRNASLEKALRDLASRWSRNSYDLEPAERDVANGFASDILDILNGLDAPDPAAETCGVPGCDEPVGSWRVDEYTPLDTGLCDRHHVVMHEAKPEEE
jgi:hypothetical protein